MKEKEKSKQTEQPKNDKSLKEEKAVIENSDEPLEDEFDFGGLPKGVPFKRNLGCGG
ncbi:MAG: hypothetical protein ACJAR3_000747 [Roseivirga sp.]|jgi:hypothetical protein